MPRVRRTALAAVAVAAVSLPLPPLGAAHASCAAGELRLAGGRWVEDGRPSVVPGRALVVEGRRFATCDDTGEVAVDRFGCEHPDRVEPAAGLLDVELLLVQDGHSWSLGHADASDSGRVSWQVTVPDDVPAGPARLEGGAASSLPVRVVPVRP